MKLTNQKKLYIKRAVFALLIIITAVLQTTKGALPVINGAHAMLLVPLTVAIGMHERNLAGLFFGAFAGILWDMHSISTDGYFSVMLAATGFICAVLITFVLRNNIFSSLLLNFIAIFLCNSLYWFFFFFLKDYDSQWYVYFKYYFSSVFYTMLFSPIYYYLIKWITNLTAPEKKRISY